MSAQDYCPDLEQLRRLLDDALTDAEQRALQTHLEGCAGCQVTLERLAAAGPSWDRAARHLRSPTEPADPVLEQVVAQLQTTDVAPGTPPGPAIGEETQAEPRAGVPDEFAFLEPPEQPGQLGRLGHYQIVEVVGRGGMGIVFKAFDERLHRVVAIKVLGPQYAASGSARKRFQREAKAAAAVSHDHVVPIYHVEETRGISYLVMPLVLGKSLQDRLDAGGPLELKEVLRIGHQIACGLAAAHKQGLVHRDIKPANILLENGVERVKITDFGLARAVDDASVTQSGVITGTPMFMSPEQARGEYTVDARSDLFSLGSVLYVMATGRLPFRASGTHAVLHRVIHDTPRPLHEINPEVPDWLEAIVAKLHAKNPADRFASAQEVADLLGRHLAHLQEPRRAPMPSRVDAGAAEATPERMDKLLEARDTRRRLVQHAGLAAGGVLGTVGVGLLVTRAADPVVGLLVFLLGLAALVVATRVKQRWTLHYRGHTVRVENSCLRGEALFIDDVLVARGGFGGRTELHGILRSGDGAGDEIMVLCEAGPLSFRCRVYVERQAARVERARPGRRGKAGTPWVRIAVVGGGVAAAVGCGISLLVCGLPLAALFGPRWMAPPPDHRPPFFHEMPVAPPPGPRPEPPMKLDFGGPWQPLFNGKDLTGWIALMPGQGDWHVEAGKLVGKGPQSSYLFTARDDFADFHLRAKVNVKAGSDSGIFFRCGRDLVNGKWPAGYEVNIANAPQFFATGTLLQTKANFPGSLILAQAIRQPNLAGPFTVELRARGNRFVVDIDHKRVAECAEMPPLYVKGRIALQVYSPQTDVRFWDIEIKEALPK